MVNAPRNAAKSPIRVTSPPSPKSIRAMRAPAKPMITPSKCPLRTTSPIIGISATTIRGCVFTNRRLWTRLVLSKDHTQLPKWIAKNPLEAIIRSHSFMVRDDVSSRLNWYRNPGSSTSAVPCILHEARRRGLTLDISCRTIPALETAITATESMSHALAGISL